MTPQEQARLGDYLDHILQAIARIQEYTAGMDEAAFQRDHRTQDAVVRNIEIIGEASRNISQRYPAFAEKHPEVRWGAAYGMRNVLAHGYFKIDIAVVWRTIADDPPLLSAQMTVMRDALGAGS